MLHPRRVHYSLAPGKSSWSESRDLYDLYENSKYAEFGERHYIHSSSDIATQDIVIECDVRGNKCKTSAEFNNLISHYLNN